jgi:hypothetical protein
VQTGQVLPPRRSRRGSSRSSTLPGRSWRAPSTTTRLGIRHRRYSRITAARLSQVFFSVIKEKVVTPNDFASLADLSATLLGFVARYNQTARPFSWKFTASDLHDHAHREGIDDLWGGV